MKEKMSVNETVRESLASALLQIMKSKELSSISVSEIARVAGVGRSSFYRNFSSKEELLCSYVVDLYREFFERQAVPHRVSHAEQTERFLLPRFRFIKDHREIFKIMHRHGLLYYFFNTLESDLILLLCGQKGDISTYYRAMFSGSCAGIVRHWIERDFAESEEELVKLFSSPPTHI